MSVFGGVALCSLAGLCPRNALLVYGAGICWDCRLLSSYYVIYIYYKMIKIQTNRQFLSLPLLFLLLPICLSTNISICNTFRMAGVYYTINSDHSNNKTKTNNLIYNYCQQVQYYCQPMHKVVKGSLIMIDNNLGCYEYQQYDVMLIDQGNISKGVKVQYKAMGKSLPENVSLDRYVEFVCVNGKEPGCPDVEESTIFTFFIDNQLGFMIALQIIGVIFMTLGLYIYRASIVLLGACTMFFILLAIEVHIIFSPGVPLNLISNILILSGICSFFAGYVFGYFPKLGIFMLGCWIGLIISLTLNNIAFYYIKSNPANLTLWIVLPIFCVLFGVLSLFIRKTFIIFATSLIGAYMSLRALSWYLGAFPNQFLLARKFHLGLTGPVSWKFYLYVIALVILTASSSALQYWLFTKKSEINNQSRDIDQEFENIEAKMKAQRQNLAEISNFKQIFKGKKGKAPKVLKRNGNSDVQSQEKQIQQLDPADLQDIDEASEEKPAISKKDLQKRFIIK